MRAKYKTNVMDTIIIFDLIDFTINIYIIKTDNTNTFHCPFEEV